MGARISFVMICASGLLLADSAAAAGGIANPENAPQLRVRSGNLEPLRAESLSFSMHPHGGGRHRDNLPSFPAAASTGVIRATGTSNHSNRAGNRFTFEQPPAAGAFHFEHAGGDVTKIVPKSYNRMCDALSDRIWQDRGGRRLKFDSNGKPGIAIEIPIN